MSIKFKPILALLLSFNLILHISADEKKISLNSSANMDWRVKAQTEIGSDSINIFASGYNISSWIKAIVPGTVFGSYVAAGLEKDPNFGDNVYKVDKAKYDRNFWYRTELKTSSLPKGKRIWLNFEGINRKGEVYFNNYRLGLLDGFMERGRYDITNLLNKTGNDVLAILVYCPTNPIPNFASPAYISSAGWDWMPYVPGLLSGITDDVYLSTTGNVSIIDPWIRTSVPSKDSANISLQYELINSSYAEKKVILKGLIQPGNIEFSQEVKIDAGKQRTFRFEPWRYTQLTIKNPKLWWPNGYGEQNLYTCDLTCLIDNEVSDTKTFRFGIREYSYDTIPNGTFQIKVNGEPIFVRGGNWGMSEYMLRCRGEEYDLKVRLHKEMHFNMIRNWIGSTTDNEFYEACDKYGIMVWDDFWLNSSRNLPDDIYAFNKNAVEKIKRMRNHPCVAVWCGDNEGYPVPPLNGWLAEDVKTFDGGDRQYHANSNSDALSGSGPWNNFHPSRYFSKNLAGWGNNTIKGWGFRTEIGTAVFTTFDSFRKFMPKDKWWPRNEMWNMHFFGPSAKNASPDKYFETVNSNYGAAKDIEDFCRKAQLVNIEINKAMYEGWQHNIWNDATGIMTWMSQSAYPSLVWQTYDYYYDLNGAYWGVKKACEPVHIQWSTADNTVKVINTTLTQLSNLQAEATVYNMDGEKMNKYGQKVTINAAKNGATLAFVLNFEHDNLTYGKKTVALSVSKNTGEQESKIDSSKLINTDLSPVHFIKLSLKDKEGKLLSDNFYWCSNKMSDYQELNKLPKAKLKVSSTLKKKEGKSIIYAKIRNVGSSVAFAVHVQAYRTSDGERILPAISNDNYFTLFQNESKDIEIEFDASILKIGEYKLLVTPYNN